MTYFARNSLSAPPASALLVRTTLALTFCSVVWLVGCQSAPQQVARAPGISAPSNQTALAGEVRTAQCEIDSPSLVTGQAQAHRVNALLDRYAASVGQTAELPSSLMADQLNANLAYGFDLAARGSILHSRKNFLDSLLVIANQRDQAANTTAHSDALRQAVTALQEADQIAQADLFLAPTDTTRSLVARQQTSALLLDQEKYASGLQLVRRYFAFAEERLTFAVSGNPDASLALYALARSELVPRFGATSPLQIRRPKAAMLLQAAIRVDASNSIALNELGVLSAKAGQFDAAEQLLRTSAELSQRSDVHANLAAVYRSQGRHDLAEATIEQMHARGIAKEDSRRQVQRKWPIRWVTTKELAAGRISVSEPSISTTDVAGSSSIQLTSHAVTVPQTACTPAEHIDAVLTQHEIVPLPHVDSGVETLSPSASQQATPLPHSPASSTNICGAEASPRCGLSCQTKDCCQRLVPQDWNCARPIPWEFFGQGEYVGPARSAHLPEYRLRVDDQLEFVYRLTADATRDAYRIRVGDILRVESATSEKIDRQLTVQPDGKVTIVNIGQVHAEGLTIEGLRSELEKSLQTAFERPAISVYPIKLNSKLEELRSSVDSRSGNGGQSRKSRVAPDGSIQLPGVGAVPAQGLSLSELQIEIELLYRARGFDEGMEVTPILVARAPRFVYVLGEAKAPGRYSLEGPTSISQAIAMAGGWNVGADLRRVVVLRRDNCWQLMATQACLHDGLYGKTACPDDLWLRDSDVVIIPKRKSLVLDEAIDLVFTRGIYGILPFGAQYQFTNFRTF